MRYVATIDSAEHEFELEELTGHSLRIKLGEEKFDVDVRHTGHTSFSIIVADRAFDFEVARHTDELIVASRGTAVRVTLQDAAKRVRHPQRGHASGKAELKAMMPGRVVNVLVNIGDKVATQQGVVVVEAMKMENELKSPKEGTVTTIKVKPGQTVEKGDLLIVIE